ncbi:MAG: hypothetical protein JW846_05945 [Dehalococcoidia bacterium]|nr:hypothetical protein [Dehalococcoidia bacterium]
MKTSRSRRLAGLVLGLIVLISVPGVALADDTVVSPIDITVAPSTLNLSYQGPCVTVHTNLTYTSALETDFAWSLNGAPSYSVFPDDCGDLVAKFHVEDIAAVFGDISGPTDVTLTLTGAGEAMTYAGSDDIRIINVTGPKNGR